MKNLKETRIIWCQDQYTTFQMDETFVFVGREKGESFEVFRLNRVGHRNRSLQQRVELNQEWYWDPTLCRLNVEPSENLESSPQDFPCEDVLRGYGAFNLEDLSSQIKVQEIPLSTGAQALILGPKNPKSWVVSLHGGPESWEGRELRYCGLYRDLLRDNIGVIILNYLGSKYLGEVTSSRKTSILKDFSALLESLNLDPGDLSLFGVSFGGALALLLHKEFGINNTFVSSPLLDLNHQRRRAGKDFGKWFEENFIEEDFLDLSFEQLTSIERGKVHALYSLEDEVLGLDPYRKLFQSKKHCPNWKIIERNGGHAPQTYQENILLKNFAQSALSLNCGLWGNFPSVAGLFGS